MRVNGHPQQTYVGKSDRAISPERTEAGASAPGTNSPTAAMYAPAPQLVQLRKLLSAQPEIRAERVAAAAQKLVSGYYNTRDAAESTAAAILREEI